MSAFDFEQFRSDEIALSNTASSTLAEVTKKVRANIQREADRDEAIMKTAELLSELDKKLERERAERDAAEKAARRRDRITTTIAVLTLIATILIGVISISLQTRQQSQSTPLNMPNVSPTSSIGDDPEN